MSTLQNSRLFKIISYKICNSTCFSSKNKTDCPVHIILLLFWLPMLFNVSTASIHIHVSTAMFENAAVSSFASTESSSHLYNTVYEMFVDMRCL